MLVHRRVVEDDDAIWLSACVVAQELGVVDEVPEPVNKYLQQQNGKAAVSLGVLGAWPPPDKSGAHRMSLHTRKTTDRLCDCVAGPPLLPVPAALVCVEAASSWNEAVDVARCDDRHALIVKDLVRPWCRTAPQAPATVPASGLRIFVCLVDVPGPSVPRHHESGNGTDLNNERNGAVVVARASSDDS